MGDIFCLKLNYDNIEIYIHTYIVLKCPIFFLILPKISDYIFPKGIEI